MTDLSSYEATKLSDDGEFMLSRYARAGEASLLVLTASRELTAVSMAKLERAYALRDRLNPAWAARPRELVDHHGRPRLISEDPGGELLSRQTGTRLSTGSFLRVAMGVAGALRQLHAGGLVHK